MADTSITLNVGMGGATIAVDNDGTDDHQYVKIEYGASGTQTRVVETNGLPVKGDQKIGDAAGATDTGLIHLAIRDDVLSSLADPEGDLVGLRTDATGALWTRAASVSPGTAASNLGKASDAAWTTGDVGVLMLGVENAAEALRSGTAGDYTPIATNDLGDVFAELRPTSGPSQRLVNVQDAVANASAQGIAPLAVRNNTPGMLSQADGDFVLLQVNNLGSLWVAVQPGAAVRPDGSFYNDANNANVASPVHGNIAIAGTTGNTTIAVGIASFKVRVLSMSFVASADTNIYIHDGTDTLYGSASAPMELKANQGIVIPECHFGIFEALGANRNVQLNQSGTANIAGHVTYVQVL